MRLLDLENALVKEHTAGSEVIFGDRADHPAKSWEDTPQAGWVAVEVAVARAHPAATSGHRGAVMDGEIGWIMSSRSTGNGGSCVQARCHAGWIEVRNSKSPDAGTVRFTAEEWDSFLDGAKKGEFDRLLAG
jgi:hypothetical protein